MTNKWLPDLPWHREALSNQRGSLAGREKALLRMQAEVQQLRIDVEFYQRQIDEAERVGKTAFDRDRFLKSRRKL